MESAHMPKRPVCPCTPDCNKRGAGCHWYCPRYKVYSNLRDKYYAKIGAIKEQERRVYEHVQETAKRGKRHGK